MRYWLLALRLALLRPREIPTLVRLILKDLRRASC
jgi:hypothetical protein